MTWDTLSWRPLDASSLPAAESLAEFAPILRSAVEEAMSAARSAPVVIELAEVAQLTASALPESAVPIASVELVGAPRRLVLAALEADPGTGSGTSSDPASVGRSVLKAVDEAVAAIVGEGLGPGPAEAASLPAEASLVALRLAFGGPNERLARLVLVAETAAVGELAAHVAALRALEAAATPPPSDAVPGDAVPSNAGEPKAASSQAGPEPVQSPSPGRGRATDGPGGTREAAIRPVAFVDLGAPESASPREPARSIDLLLGVQLQVSVEIGRTRLPIRDVLALAPGSIVELDKLAGEKADVLVNGHPVAQGEVVVVDENFGIRITDVVSRQRRILSADGAP